MNEIRNDIQALRAIAVLSVIFYHFKIFSFKGGYLGVDIFFVISGFLVTQMITKGLANDNFSFIEFYIRRAKRLLPATYSTFFITSLFSFFLLTSKELYDFLHQLLGAVTFTANYFLFFQGTYFGGEGELKPLLHTWSLSIEEQYYFLLPLILFLTPPRLWLIIGSLLLLVSLFSGLYVKNINPSAAFYFFPFRAWELALGSILAIHIKYFLKINLRPLLLPSYIIIFLLLINPISPSHPGIDAIVICFLTALVIAANYSFKDSYLLRFATFTGDISYSLYLIHWPIYAIFMNIWFGDNLSFYTGLGMLVLSYILAFAQYKFIETPFRKIDFSNKKINLLKFFIPAIGIIFIAFIPINSIKNDDIFFESRQANTGFSSDCTFDEKFVPSDKCVQGKGKKILVWGDSNAMHLIDGISKENSNNTIIQATKYVCGPFPGVAPVGRNLNTFQNNDWARSCISFNNSVMEFILKEEIDLVILSSSLHQYIDPENFNIVTDSNQFSGTIYEQIDFIYLSLLENIKFLNSQNINHLFIGPPPALEFDLGRCAERYKKNLISIGKYKNCSIKNSEVRELKPNNYNFFKKLQSNPEINFINLDEILFHENKIIFFDENNLFIENAHLSRSGSNYVAKKINFKEREIKID